MTAPAQPLYLWWYNAARRRHELWSRNPADPPGVGRVVAVQGVQGEDHSDLAPDVQFTPYSQDILVALQSEASPALLNAATDALNTYYQQQGYNMAGGGTASAQPGGQTTLRDTPADINTMNRLYGGVLDTEAARRQLDQQEVTLRQKMAAAGYTPQQQADFFAQGGGQQGSDLPPQPDVPGASFAGRMPNAYVDAYGDTNRLAQRAALMQRAQALQQVANTFESHKTGADRLGEYGAAIRARDKAAAQYALDEQRLAADPSNDRRRQPMVGGQWSTNPQGYMALENAGDDIAQMEQQWYPDVYAAEQRRKQEDAQGGWLPPDVRRQLYPQALPRFAGGGEYYYTAATGSNPTAGSAPTMGGQYEATGGPPQGANTIQQDQDAYRQQSFGNEMQQRDVSQQLAQIQQQAAFQAQQMQAAHQQRMQAVQQQYALINTEIARAQSGVAQQSAMARAEYPLLALPARGPAWAG